MPHFNAKMHQIRFRLGLRPIPAGGAHTYLDLRGSTFKWMEGIGWGEEGQRGRELYGGDGEVGEGKGMLSP